ncbi:MAG: YqgE/AlgH family protein [Acetobacteraceae bacterium]|nr:YqgE/AlgH family protein [Acetobacteraceae bacterium]
MGPSRVNALIASDTAPRNREPDGFLTGQLLIAMPAMADPRFAQTIICICAHTPEGAMGIVLNRPLERPSFADLLRQLDIGPTPPRREIAMCAGGPVDIARGFMLHTPDWTDQGTLLVGETMALTASLDVLRAVAADRGPRACILALGYAGWAPGQLDQEIHANTWLSVDAEESLVFDSVHETKWRRAFDRLHVDPLLLSQTAGHA